MLDDIITMHHSDSRGFCRHYLLLYSIVLGLETKSAFEFGAGLSTIVILEALSKTDGKLISCDRRDMVDCGLPKQKMWKYGEMWTFLCSDSAMALLSLGEQSFDFVLHDGSHGRRTVYKDIVRIVKRIKMNGLLLVHDVKHPKYSELSGAVSYALKAVKHQRVDLPYGYGLSVIRIDEDFGVGKVVTKWRKR